MSWAPPRTPTKIGNSWFSLVFEQNWEKSSSNFWKFLKVYNITIENFVNFFANFSSFRLLHPEPPIKAFSTSPHRENDVEKLFWNFSIIFNNFNNFYGNLGKLPQISCLRSTVKFCPGSQKTDTPNICWTPQPKDPACITAIAQK